jgi:pentatricopeptide repeat protein
MTSEGLQPETSTWNSVIFSCVDCRKINLALDVLREMTLKYGINPNPATFNILLAIIAEIRSGNIIKELHGFILRNLELIGLGPVDSDRVISSLASGYAHNKLVEYAHRLFLQVRLKINLLFSSVIEAFLGSGQNTKAFNVFREMAFQFGYDARPISNFSLTLILPKCAQISKRGLEIHAYAYRNNLERDTSVCNALMAMYAKRGDITSAGRIFQGNFDKDRVSWNTIISIYSTISDFSTAFSLFNEMTSYEIRPDEYTFSCLLNCCGFCSYLKQVMTSHARILKMGLYVSYPAVQNALMDAYHNCGCIQDAQKVFDEIGSKDLVSWNTIISSYGFSTEPVKSFTLFRTMKERGYRPNLITFTALLTACSHMGLVDEALYHFKSMRTKYGITPDLGHYCCIVDCLARVGELYRAFEFIEAMPIEPDDQTWSALLNGCRIHGQPELAEIVTKKLLDLDPDHSGYWVLLSNTYADASRWNDKEQIRAAMKKNHIKKMPGLSWVETNRGELHSFFNGDKLHVRCDEIYSALHGLMANLRDEHCEPVLDLDL